MNEKQIEDNSWEYSDDDFELSLDSPIKVKTHYSLCSEELLEYSLKGLETIKV